VAAMARTVLIVFAGFLFVAVAAACGEPPVAAAGVSAANAAATASADPVSQWPQFRGPGSAGISRETGLPSAWSVTENVVWRTKIPGRGWSSPIVWGDRVFVTSAIQEEGQPESAKKGLYIGGERLAAGKKQRFVVYCLDAPSGKILWERTAGEKEPKHGHHIKNSFASETPVTDGQRVYAYFGPVGLVCFDFAGKELWSRSWGDFATRYNWGTAASPAIHGDRIYVVNDNEEASFLAAVDKRSGEQVWKIARDEKSNWSTPFVWQNDQRTEIVTTGSKRVRSYDLDGHLLWELGGLSSITIPTPFAGHGLLYVTSGFIIDRKRPLFAVRPGASGDISLKPGETQNASIAWCQRLGGPYNPSPLLYGDYVYVLYDRGQLACFDARTGKENYKTQIDPKVQAFTSSPWAYDGKVFCLSEDGDTLVIEAGPKFKLLRRNNLGELCLATPVIAGRSLLIRTESQLVCIRGQ
jgi:outer membrane protein assembly factor BamB